MCITKLDNRCIATGIWCIDKLGVLHANQISIYICVLIHIWINLGWGWRRETDLSPPVKLLTVPRRYFFLGFFFMFFFCFFCVCYAFVRVSLFVPPGHLLGKGWPLGYFCLMDTYWERADLLALVCGAYCEFVTFSLVSWVWCGTWLYRFLIFVPLLTL